MADKKKTNAIYIFPKSNNFLTLDISFFLRITNSWNFGGKCNKLLHSHYEHEKISLESQF